LREETQQIIFFTY